VRAGAIPLNAAQIAVRLFSPSGGCFTGATEVLPSATSGAWSSGSHSEPACVRFPVSRDPTAGHLPTGAKNLESRTRGILGGPHLVDARSSL
jgi:hypothetical protein